VIQGQLPLGASDLLVATHKAGRKANGASYTDVLWLTAYGNFPQGFPVELPDALVRVEAFKDMEAEDCYYTPSGFNNITKRQSRGIQNVSKLTCLFADLDYYGTSYADLSPMELVDQIMADHPWLPTPSVIIDSGRGCWMFWLFQRPLVINKRTKKSADWVPQWYSCQQFLNELLKPYGADPNAVDASRYVRLPETINSKSGNVAQSWIYATHKGKRVDYQFTDLQALFRERVPSKQKRKVKRGNKPHGKINGIDTILTGYSLAHGRMKDMELIIQKRGGILDDMRKRMVDCYLVEAAHFCASTDSLLATVDGFVDRYFDDPDTYKAYYRKHYSRKIHRAEYVRTQLTRKSREQAFLTDENGKWKQAQNRFIHTNKRIIRLLEIMPEDMRKVSRRPYLTTLIDKDEKSLRRRERDGAIPRDEYLKRASERSERARELQSEGLSIRQISKRMGVSKSQVQRYLA
jgi:hypothetical protein